MFVFYDEAQLIFAYCKDNASREQNKVNTFIFLYIFAAYIPFICFLSVIPRIFSKFVVMKKVVIAIDSFKGCLSSEAVEQAAGEGVLSVFPQCEVVCVPVADGGEGMLDVLLSSAKGEYVTLEASGPLMEKRMARYGISADGRTAFIEMATISGLPLVPEDERNPMLTTTFGVGELIADALSRGCKAFIIGLGGSATNDAGLGMLQALGFRFLDKSGQLLGTGGKILAEVASVDFSQVNPLLRGAHFKVACDVNNPFFGKNGAAHIFAPQKGADAAMVEALDRGLQSLSRVILEATGKDVSNLNGAGAAGGMGGGMVAFLNAVLQPGIQLLLDTIHFTDIIRDSDLIITGEGRADKQTLMGKVPSGILEAVRQQQIPVVLIAGSITDEALLCKAGFKGVFSITPSPMSLEEAMKPEVARRNVKGLVEQLCRILQH